MPVRGEMRTLAVLVLVALFPACARRGTDEAEMQTPPPAGPAESRTEAYREPSLGAAGGGLDELAQLEGRLAHYEARLRQEGVAVGAYAEHGDAEAAQVVAGAEGDVARGPTRKEEAGNKEAEKKNQPAPATRAADASAPKDKRGKAGGRRDGDGFAAPPPPRDEADRCKTVCELSTAICELQVRICDLAADHPGDVRYDDACARASDDCRVATEACQACAE